MWSSGVKVSTKERDSRTSRTRGRGAPDYRGFVSHVEGGTRIRGVGETNGVSGSRER